MLGSAVRWLMRDRSIEKGDIAVPERQSMKSPRPIFFCHIPKTGGSSLRLAIEASVKPYQIMPDAHMMARFGGHYPDVDLIVENLLRQRDAIRLLRGHYHLSIRSLLVAPVTITILRNPVDRVISNLKHNIQYNGMTEAEIRADLDSGITRGVAQNAMTRYLGGEIDPVDADTVRKTHHDLLYGPIHDEDAMLRSATQALKTIDILGFSENLAEISPSLADLGILNPVKRVNVSQPNLLDLRHADRERIQEMNSLDVALYDEALKISRGA